MRDQYTGLPPAREIVVDQGRPEQRFDLVESARQAWEARYAARDRRRRARDYFAGKQWETSVDPDTGEVIDEAERMREQGRIPWVMNEIRPILQNLRGQYRQQESDVLAVSREREDAEADDMMSVALEQVFDINEIDELDADQFLEDLLAGCFGWRVRVEWNAQLNRDEVAIDPVDQNRLFYNPDLNDRRGRDLRYIGMIHDWTLDQVIAEFAGTRREAAAIRELYAEQDRFDDYDEFLHSWSGFDAADRLNWYYPEDPNHCRVVEIWREEYRWNRYVHDPLDGSYELTDLSDEQIATVNHQREREAAMLGLPEAALLSVDEQYEPVWTGYYTTPDGFVLWEGETPYWHEEHPFVIGFPLLLDGEHWGIVDDIIDPQRLQNRMTAAIDFLFGVGAKGLLLVPEDAIPDGMNIEDFAEEWSRMGGAIKFRAKPGVPLPQQITANAVPAGIFEWLGTQRDWMQSISGVNGPVQGADAANDTPASLYGMQIEQGQVSNLDYFKSFYAARKKRDLKALQLVLQFFERRPMRSRRMKRVLEFDPATVRGLTYDLTLQDTANTATMRQLFEDQLMGFLDAQRLTFGQYLELSSHPKAEAIQRVIEATNPLLSGQPVNPALVEAAQAGDPDATALLQQAA